MCSWISWAWLTFSQHWIWPRATGRFPCPQGLRINQPSPPCTVCTNSLRFHLGCSVPRPPSSASWTGCCARMLCVQPPTWMMWSSTEHMQQVAAVLESLRWAGLTANPKKCAVGWGRYVIWDTAWVAGRSVLRWIRQLQLLPARDPRWKKSWGGSWGWRATTGSSLIALWTWPDPRLTSPERVPQIQSSGWYRASWCLRRWNKPSVGSLSSTHLTFLSIFSCRPMLWTGDWGRCCLSRCREETVRCFTSPGSCPRGSLDTAPSRILAIRWAVGALRYYLLGQPFILCSDHAPLQWPHERYQRPYHLVAQMAVTYFFAKTTHSSLEKATEVLKKMRV